MRVSLIDVDSINADCLSQCGKRIADCDVIVVVCQQMIHGCRRALKQAIALRPDSTEAHNLMGVLHELRHEHDASYRAYRAALKADRHYQPAQHNMRRYYERFTFGRSDVPVDTGVP